MVDFDKENYKKYNLKHQFLIKIELLEKWGNSINNILLQKHCDYVITNKYH